MFILGIISILLAISSGLAYKGVPVNEMDGTSAIILLVGGIIMIGISDITDAIKRLKNEQPKN